MKITEFFYKLTRANWGFPWHIILAITGMRFSTVISRLMIEANPVWHIVLAFFIINTIGYIYELVQGKREDTSQDLIANISGTIIGALMLI